MILSVLMALITVVSVLWLCADPVLDDEATE